MKFVCDKCKTKYSIADDKVRRKVLKIRCKNCSNIIVVREPGRGADQDPATTLPRSAGSGVRPLARAFDGAFRGSQHRPSSPLTPLPVSSRIPDNLPSLDADDDFGPEATRLSAVPDFLSESAAPEDEWYLAVDGNQYGPMGLPELCSRVRRGETGGEAFVWRDGFDDWLELNDVPELRPYLPKHPPPPPRGKSGLYPMQTPRSPTVLPSMPPAPQHPAPQSAFGPQTPASAPPTSPGLPHVGGRGGSHIATPIPQTPLIQPQQMQPPQMQPPQMQPQAPQMQVPLFQQVPPAEQLPLPGPAQEMDLAPLPPMNRPSQEVMPLPPVALPPQSRTPLWMVSAGIGGGLAAICGLFLVGYFLFFERGEKDPPKLAMNTQQPAAHHPSYAPDAGSEPIDFPPLEINRSEKPERRVTPRQPRPRPAAKKVSTGRTPRPSNLLDLYKDRGNPSSEAPAAPSVTRTVSDPRRRISVSELIALQKKHRASLKACYERALKRDDSLTEVKAEVEVSIGNSGIVRSVRVSAGNNPDLVTCIARSIKRWAFPSIGAQSFSFPIIFRGT